MFQLWKTFCSESRLAHFTNFKATSKLFKRHRPEHRSMVTNPFLPPSDVKGMKLLEKDRFTKAVSVPCIYVPFNCIKDAKQALKSYSLKLQNFKPLTGPTPQFIEKLKANAIDVSGEEGKMAILDSRKIQSFKDISEKDRSVLLDLGLNEKYFSFSELLITYDNFKADEILRAVIPSEFDSVSGYSLVGHIIHLNLRDHLVDYKQLISMVFLDKVKNARSVVNKIDIIEDKFRSFRMELLCGDDDMIVTVRENKCVFKLDFSQVYWNPRLSTEHERIVDKLGENDVLYDVFCGIGPFAIPAAKKGCFVMANDLNPHAINWLKTNIKLNKIKDNLHIFNKDGNEFIKTDLRQHILSLSKEKCKSINIVMNLPALAPTFLPSFQRLFSDSEVSLLKELPIPKVIVYCFVKGVCDASEMALKLISEEIGIALKKESNEVEDIFFVRDVAPNKKMMRVTLLLTERLLDNNKRPVDVVDSDLKRLCQ